MPFGHESVIAYLFLMMRSPVDEPEDGDARALGIVQLTYVCTSY